MNTQATQQSPVILYTVVMEYDGITRKYHCETHYDTVVLFDALYKGAKWDRMYVLDYRLGTVIQGIGH
jgi:hypothetical protein